MSYFYCNNCEEIFPANLAQISLRSNGYGSTPMWCCPNCRSTDLTDAGTCKVCGEAIEPNEEYCADCKEGLYKIWDEAVCKVIELCKDSDGWTEARDKFVEYLDDVGVF